MSHATPQVWAVDERAVTTDTGVYVPFLAPMLTGARARLHGEAIDYILPNPSGGRGSYVACWSMVNDLAAPTLHDRILSKRLLSLPALTPGAVRATARAVASEGYAGRDVAEAAMRAQAMLDAQALRLRDTLLAGLGRQFGQSEADRAAALTSVARQLGWDPTILSYALDQLSMGLVPIVGGARPGRLRRLLAMLQALHATLFKELAHQRRPAQAGQATSDIPFSERANAGLAYMLGRLSHCVQQVQAPLETAAAGLQEPARLLQRWRDNPASAVSDVTTLDEILDGWDRICLLWMETDTLSARLRLVQELGSLLRSTGSAGSDRHGLPGGPEHALLGAPRDEAAPMLVERNERIRIRELELEDANG